MKKTKQVEVTVCDVCGEETHDVCWLCKRDICRKHLVGIVDDYESIYHVQHQTGIFCRTHIDPEILEKLNV